MTPPDRPTLLAWYNRWQAIRKAAYQELLASYTPEQRALVRRMNHAGRQAAFIKDWLWQPERRKTLPEEPPAEGEG
jgi:hypothetical protein